MGYLRRSLTVKIRRKLKTNVERTRFVLYKSKRERVFKTAGACIPRSGESLYVINSLTATSRRIYNRSVITNTRTNDIYTYASARVVGNVTIYIRPVRRSRRRNESSFSKSIISEKQIGPGRGHGDGTNTVFICAY